jgi:hypothetical protein
MLVQLPRLLLLSSAAILTVIQGPATQDQTITAAAAYFEEGNLISFDETSQILNAPWNVSTQEVITNIRRAKSAASSHGHHTENTILQASPNPSVRSELESKKQSSPCQRPQYESAWSIKRDFFPAKKQASSPLPTSMKPSHHIPLLTDTVIPIRLSATNALRSVTLRARQDGPEPLVLSPFDPDNPTFQALDFFDPDILPHGKFKCPHPGCG